MKLTLKLISIIFILGLSFNSCKKDKSISPDFRIKYIGKYQCVEKIYSYGSYLCGDSYSFEKDTIISVSYGKTDSTLNVLGRDVYLDSMDVYLAYHYSLSFRNDSIRSFFTNGGIGCGQYEVYSGKRISTKP